MSKKSRRKARRERERRLMVTALDSLTVNTDWARRLGFVVSEMGRLLPLVMNTAVAEVQKMVVAFAANATAFGPAVRQAIAANDSLPLLVYADWCEENGRSDDAQTARMVANRLAETHFKNHPSSRATFSACSSTGRA